LLARLSAVESKLASDDLLPRTYAHLCRMGMALYRDGDPWTARQYAREARACAEAVHLELSLQMMQVLVSAALWQLGLFDDPHPELRRSERSQHMTLAVIASRFLAMLLVDRGALADARELAARRLALIRSAPSPDTTIREAEWRWTLGEIAAAEGDFEAA